jgi:hypothetical protein
MARGARIVAAASMVERDVIVQRHVEDRLLLAVILVRQLAVLESDCLTLRQERYLYRIFTWRVFRGRARSVSLFFSHFTLNLLSV